MTFMLNILYYYWNSVNFSVISQVAFLSIEAKKNPGIPVESLTKNGYSLPGDCYLWLFSNNTTGLCHKYFHQVKRCIRCVSVLCFSINSQHVKYAFKARHEQLHLKILQLSYFIYSFIDNHSINVSHHSISEKLKSNFKCTSADI